MSGVRTAAGLSTIADPVAATEAACRSAKAVLGDARIDLAFVFFSEWHADAAEDITETLLKVAEPGALVGASAQAVIEGSREVENEPAVSVWIASLPGARIEPFAMDFERVDDGGAFIGFPDEVPEGATLLMLVDPYTFPADMLLKRFNEDRPGLNVIGGMASGSSGPGRTRLINGSEVRNGGAVGVLVSGSVRIRPLVSQGCRPVGEPSTVTRSDRNILMELGGKSPMDGIRETFAAGTPEDRKLMQQGLHLGRVIDEYKSEFHRGDFLIRGVMGADQETGAVAIGDLVGVGETVQWHVRDAGSADEDLRLMLSTVEEKPAGVLLFSCNGRGSHLFGEPDHDARAIQQTLGGLPLAGFFCAGELGPIGGKNFLHGFTASMALFSEA